MGYANGVDFGVSPLVDAIEPFGGNSNAARYGNMHNRGIGAYYILYWVYMYIYLTCS